MTLTPDDPKLTAYALGELDATERAAIESALARSPECRRAVAEIRALAGELTTELAADTAMAKNSLTAEPWTRAGDLQSPSAMSSTPDGDYKSPALAAVADVPGEGKVIFLPGRHWRTLGMAAAAALVVGFFVTKVWQRPQPGQAKAAGQSTTTNLYTEPAPSLGSTNKPAAAQTEMETRLRQYFQAAGVGNSPVRFWLDERNGKLAVQGPTNDLAIVQQALELMRGTRFESSQPIATASNGLVVHNWTITNYFALSNDLASIVANPVAAVFSGGQGGGGLVQSGQALFMAGSVGAASPTIYSVNAVGFVQVEPSVGFQTTSDPTKSPASGKNTITVGATEYYRFVPNPGQNAVAWKDSGVSTPDGYVGYKGTAPDPNGVVALGQTRNFYAGVAPEAAPFLTHSSKGNVGWAFRKESTTAAAYPRYVENPFTLVASEPLSTFSTDVDTASYANVRRFLNQNQLPPRDAVRIEELLNYFTYDYAPPTGEHPFAAHVEIAGCPWAPMHRLVRVGLKGRELKADKRPPSNFVFLIDVSGSMSPVTRLPLIKQSLRALVKRMTENDRVAMVVYASSSGTVLESTSAVNKELILAAIDRLEAGGSTNGGEGIQRAYDLAVANFIKGGVNRVLLCTDGDFNVGITDRGQLLKLIEEKAKSGVFLTTLGVGDDNFKDATLQQLADKGNGNYHYLDSVEEGHKVLVEQMNATLVTIAKDVKIQIEFNPAQASAYRLIGYEKRILAKQDFNNDAKDAGEIGAGHTVTALYEIVPHGVTLPANVDPLKYQTSVPQTNGTSVIPARAKRADSPEVRELVATIGQLKARIADLSLTYRPSHPTMQTLYKQSEALDKRLKALGLSTELLTLKLRYKAPDGDKSTLMEIPVTDSGAKLARASADFKFASAVASFGMLLKDSAFKGTASFDSALELAQEGKGDDTHGYRAEFINLLAKAKALKK